MVNFDRLICAAYRIQSHSTWFNPPLQTKVTLRLQLSSSINMSKTFSVNKDVTTFLVCKYVTNFIFIIISTAPTSKTIIFPKSSIFNSDVHVLSMLKQTNSSLDVSVSERTQKYWPWCIVNNVIKATDINESFHMDLSLLSHKTPHNEIVADCLLKLRVINSSAANASFLIVTEDWVLLSRWLK